MESEKEMGGVFLLDMLQWKGWDKRDKKKGEGAMDKEEGLCVLLSETCAVPCVCFCLFLWSEYCRAVITVIQFANNQQM